MKAGRLEPDEITLVQTHAAIGERILGSGSSELLNLAAEIAGNHHERWDGNGYPRRLNGAAIPLSARIVAVADVFDALTTDRPYKNALSQADALNYVMAERGRHFDPECVDAFMVGFKRQRPETEQLGPARDRKCITGPAEKGRLASTWSWIHRPLRARLLVDRMHHRERRQAPIGSRSTTLSRAEHKCSVRHVRNQTVEA